MVPPSSRQQSRPCSAAPCTGGAAAAAIAGGAAGGAASGGDGTLSASHVRMPMPSRPGSAGRCAAAHSNYGRA
eukprot:6442140-Prymnesium_polylepis.1